MTGEVTIISRTHRKISGNYHARVRYKIDDGRPLDILRRVEHKFAIKPKQAEIEVELLKNGPAQLVAGKVTFRQLAQYAKDNIYVAELQLQQLLLQPASHLHRPALWLDVSALAFVGPEKE